MTPTRSAPSATPRSNRLGRSLRGSDGETVSFLGAIDREANELPLVVCAGTVCGMTLRAIGVTVLVLLLGGCATTPDLKARMDALIGRNVSAVIEERKVYPDSSDVLPNGNTVYRFSTGSGGTVDRYGNLVSSVCRVWLEAKPDGTIVRYRYENCRD